MAKIYAPDYGKKPLQAGTETSGYNESYKFTDASASGDEIYFGWIPAGVEINGVSLVHDADADASIALGYETEAGVKTAAYFLPATALAAAGRKESVAQPIVFTEDVRLVGTTSGGAIAANTKLTVITVGKGIGVA